LKMLFNFFSYFKTLLISTWQCDMTTSEKCFTRFDYCLNKFPCYTKFTICKPNTTTLNQCSYLGSLSNEIQWSYSWFIYIWK
jgi:hypothetical protein